MKAKTCLHSSSIYDQPCLRESLTAFPQIVSSRTLSRCSLPNVASKLGGPSDFHFYPISSLGYTVKHVLVLSYYRGVGKSIQASLWTTTNRKIHTADLFKRNSRMTAVEHCSRPSPPPRIAVSGPIYHPVLCTSASYPGS